MIYIENQHATRLIRFRTTDMPFEQGKINYTPSDIGFKDLHISGSSRPTSIGLAYALSSIPMPVYIYDLFGEDHYYIQGYSESWFGYKRTKTVGQDTSRASLHDKWRRLFHTQKLTHNQQDGLTSQQMVESLGFNFLEIIQTRKETPTPEQVEGFITTINSLPENAWVHYHCSAGRGRTTVYMVMHDILKNGKQVSLKDILLRHYLIGSEDLSDTTVWPKGHYTKEMLLNRKDFIEAFYEYATHPEGMSTCSWSTWLEKNKDKLS